MDGMLRIVAFPDEDEVFVSRVRGAVARLDGGSGKNLDIRAALIGVLRDLLPEYPNLEIRQQDGLASFEEEPRTWYFYRDGSATSR